MKEQRNSLRSRGIHGRGDRGIHEGAAEGINGGAEELGVSEITYGGRGNKSHKNPPCPTAHMIS
jgi:hypothetical protein